MTGVLLLVVPGAGCPDAGRGLLSGGEPPVHEVLVVSRPGHFAFEPSEVTAARGDRVRFVQTGHLVQSVIFDVSRLEDEALNWLRGRGLDSGPLLTRPGEAYEVDFESAPPGSYPFHSAAHAELGMRGVILVE
jgi:plastocyanin